MQHAAIVILTLVSLVLSQASLEAGQDAGYTIRRYDLLITPDFSAKRITVRALVDIDNPGHDSVFVFGLNDRYDSMRVSEGHSAATAERANGWVTVTLNNPATNIRLDFRLEGSLGQSNDEKREIVADSSLFLLWSDRFYPIDFHRWANVRTELVVPAGFRAVAPGRLTATRSSGRSVTYVFETSQPAVSFSVLADARWIATERNVNGMHLHTLLHPGSQKYAEQIFRTSAEILGFFSENFLAYPFDQFTFVTTVGVYARRAYPGFVGYEPGYLEKEFTSTGHDAHETSLLWWTYTTHGRGPGSFQWTEGFGDYAELLYDETFGKPIPRVFERFRKEYLALPPEQDLPYADLRGNTPQKFVHGKYPWLMHMIRHVVGDSLFRRGMKLLFTRFQHTTFTMDEFIGALEEGCGQSLQWWKEEWLERKGVPIIATEYEIRKTGEGFRVACMIEQRGNLYHFPVDIGIVSRGGMTLHRVELTGHRQVFSFDMQEEPAKVVLDPKGWVLMQVVPIVP